MLVIFVYFNVFLYASFAYQYFFNMELTSFKPLYWYLITIVFGLIINFFKYGISLPPVRLKQLILWTIPFLALSSFSFIAISGTDDGSLQTLINYAKGGALLIVFSLVLRDSQVSQHAVYALIFVVLTAVVINIIEYLKLIPWQLSKDFGRAAGLYGNANISGKMLVLGMAVTVFSLPKKLRFYYCLIVFVGVLLTFSRSSMMIWFLVLLGLSWSKAFVLPRTISFSIIGGGVFFATSLLISGALVGILGSAGVELNQNTTARMSGSFLSQQDNSSQGRTYVAKRGISIFLNNPIFGKGIGLGNNNKLHLGAHNSYIQMAAEQGIFGLAIFLSLIWMIWRVDTIECKLFSVGFAAFSMFTHNMLDQPTMYLLIAIVVSGMSSEINKKQVSGNA